MCYNDKYFDSYFGIFEYKDEIRDRIIEYKFKDKSYLYRFFVEIILKDKIAVDYIQKFDYIIPVPLHKKKLKKRGYNQTELIAKAIGKRFIDIEYCKNILEKVRNTEAQSTLNREARGENVKGAFRINPFVETFIYKNKNILLLDDIYTTGNTANECSKILKQQLECKKVGVFTIAKD